MAFLNDAAQSLGQTIGNSLRSFGNNISNQVSALPQAFNDPQKFNSNPFVQSVKTFVQHPGQVLGQQTMTLPMAFAQKAAPPVSPLNPILTDQAYQGLNTYNQKKFNQVPYNPQLGKNSPTLTEVMRAIQEGSQGDPVATMSAQMVNTGKDMPIFQKYPFLPVAQSQLESRGLKDFSEKPDLVNKPKQAFGWGALLDYYNPKTVSETLNDMMTAVGTDRAGESKARQANASYYAPFRQSGNLDDYALTYAGPRNERNPYAGEVYAQNMKTIMNKYAEKLDQIMKERGASFPYRY